MKRLLPFLFALVVPTLAAAQVTPGPISSRTASRGRAINGTEAVPSYSFAADTDTGLYNPSAANTIAFTFGGVNAFHLQNGFFDMKSTTVFGWAAGDPTSGGCDTCMARGAAGAFQFKTATATTTLTLPTGTGNVLPVVVAKGRATAQAAANASVSTFTVGASDATFEVSANVLVTTATTHDFDVQVTYTDEGNTARTVTLPFRLVGSTTALVASIVNGNGTVPYLGVPVHIRAKAATVITVITEAAGTYTTVAYNVEGYIKQIS